MWDIVFNIVTFLFILKLNIFQTCVSGQLTYIENETPSIHLESCAAKTRGMKGDKGEMIVAKSKWNYEKADQGIPGWPGNQGNKGELGICKCSCPPEHSSSGEEDDIETRPNNVLISCKDAKDKESDINIGEENPFGVRCEYDGPNVYTCLSKTNQLIFDKENLEEISYTLGDKPFWLSERPKDKDKLATVSSGFNLKDFYFGNDISKLRFLQKHLEYAIQKIRYHCKNSTPQEALQMLTWTGQVVGPVATDRNPFYYVIENDGCKDASAGSWSYTDINLRSSLGRLPVLDFYIKDTGNRDQKFYIELLELCFG